MAISKQCSKCGRYIKFWVAFFIIHNQQSYFLTVCPQLFCQNLTSRLYKFSMEGRGPVIFRRKYKQFAKIDAKLVMVGIYSDLCYVHHDIIINKHADSLFIVTLIPVNSTLQLYNIRWIMCSFMMYLMHKKLVHEQVWCYTTVTHHSDLNWDIFACITSHVHII